MRKVVVTLYNEAWPSMYKAEANRIDTVFGTDIIDIHHIGSTSVPGLKAKPVIDIMPVARDINRVDAFNTAMIDIGYEPKGENGLLGRRYFQKGGDDRTHHVHVYEMGHPDIRRHLAFRDYLRAHPNTAEEYGNLKEELALRFPNDMKAYINGKEQLVLAIEARAVVWCHRGENKRI